MLILRATNLHWLDVTGPDPVDLCAHSPVELVVGTARLVEADAGDWTVSASALYLLRTLERAHTKSDPVGDHLFPCCGFNMYDIAGKRDVVIVGCPNGVDLEVARHGDQINITSTDGQKHAVAFEDWKRGVCRFSRAVREFYKRSPTRKPAGPENKKGFRKFMNEWDRRLKTCADQ